MNKTISVFLTLLTVIVVYFYYQSARPFGLTADMGLSESFMKRYSVLPNHSIFTSIIKYSSASADLLANIPNDSLQGLRCSDQFIRTDQGMYILKHIKTQERQKRRVTNKEFIEYMRSKEPNLPVGKKTLTVRVCEAENRTLFILYSIGVYDKKMADNASLHQVIYSSQKNETFIDVFQPGLLGSKKTFRIESTRYHEVCNEVFQLGTDNTLYLLCSEESPAESTHRLYVLDLNTGNKSLVGACVNGYPPNIGSVCN